MFAQLVFRGSRGMLLLGQKRMFCSGASINMIELLREKVRSNCLFANQILSEHDYYSKIDESFRVYPIVLQLSKQEEQTLEGEYMSLLDNICSKKLTKQKMEGVDKELFQWIQEKMFKMQSENYLKFERVSNSSVAIPKSFHIQHRGHLQIFGVSRERGKNEFIHKYTYAKNSSELRFQRRITSQEKIDQLQLKDILPEELQGRTAKLTKEIQKMMSKETSEKGGNSNQGIRGMFLNVSKKLGFDAHANNTIDGSKYFLQMLDFKKKTHEIMSKNEEYILVEDFLLRTTETIRIKDLSGEILWEDHPDQNGLFTHFIRTEALCNINESLSVKSARKRIISDIDGSLLGNPPCLIKHFDQANPQ